MARWISQRSTGARGTSLTSADEVAHDLTLTLFRAGTLSRVHEEACRWHVRGFCCYARISTQIGDPISPTPAHGRDHTVR